MQCRFIFIGLQELEKIELDSSASYLVCGKQMVFGVKRFSVASIYGYRFDQAGLSIFIILLQNNSPECCSPRRLFVERFC